MKFIEPSIRKVYNTDLLLLQEISKNTFRETFTEFNSEENMTRYLNTSFSLENLSKQMDNLNSEFYFAIHEENIVGYLKINTGNAQTEIKEEIGMEIERIYVLKEYHGMRVGQSLFEKAMQLAEEKKVEYVWLGVWENNKRAIAFYSKNGFQVFDRHLFQLGDDVQTDYMMKKRLDQ